MTNIQFVKYEEGSMYCDGILTVTINGLHWTFGSKNSCDFPKFWTTGGSYDTDTGEIISLPWELNKYNIDAVYKALEGIVDDPYKTISDCLNLMNENVNYGCCGECL